VITVITSPNQYQCQSTEGIAESTDWLSPA